MENLLDRICVHPDVCNGKPVVRDLHITVSAVLDCIASGDCTDIILSKHPLLEEADIYACVHFATMIR